MLRTAAAVVLALVATAAAPGTASADRLVFRTGRTMSVQAVRADGDTLFVTFRGGGEAIVPSSLVERIEPDEVVDEPATPADTATAPASDAGLGAVSAVAVEALAARPFATLIAAAAATHGVDVRLVHAVIEAESNYQPRARSRKGAKGLMQLMPATARQYAVRDPYDPQSNIDAGVRHLKDLLTRFDVRLALAAYNAGEGTVRSHGGLPPFAETRAYVARILGRIGR